MFQKGKRNSFFSKGSKFFIVLVWKEQLLAGCQTEEW